MPKRSTLCVINIDQFPNDLRWELRAAAAEAEMTLRDYVIAALKTHLEQTNLAKVNGAV